MKELPWQKKSAGRNLEIIKKSVKEIEENANLNFKEVINKNAIEYDLKFLESSTKAIVPNTYRGKTYTDNLESYDEFFIEEIPSSHEMNEFEHSLCRQAWARVHCRSAAAVLSSLAPMTMHLNTTFISNKFLNENTFLFICRQLPEVIHIVANAA